MSTSKQPMFNISAINSNSQSTNVKHSVKKTLVTSLSTVALSAEVIYDGIDIIGNELKAIKLTQRLEQIDDLVADFGLSTEEANSRKQAILTKHLGV